MSKEDKLRELTLDIKSCKKCPLCYTRDRPSVQRGDPRSPLMVVGDLPRETDHREGIAFAGRAGNKIDDLLTRAGIKPESVYFTTILKCFPGRMGRFPEDNSPAQCYGWLAAQIKIIQPKLVVLAGPEALYWTLLRGSKEDIEPFSDWMGPTLRRRDVYGELRFMVLPHPSVFNKEKNLSLEDKCVKVLTTAKEFIVSRQKGELTPHIDVIDIEKKIVRDRKAQIEGIKWQNPALLKPEEKPPAPPTS